MASTMFANGIKKLSDGSIDFDGSNVIRAVLTKSSYNTTINKDTHDFLDDVPSGDRASGTFKVIGSRTITVSPGGDKVFFAGPATVTYPTVTNGLKVGGVVIFKSSSGTESACPLICYCQFSANLTADGGTVTVTFNTSGIFQSAY